MNFFQEFRTETKLLFLVALTAVIFAAGFFWWQAQQQEAPTQQEPAQQEGSFQVISESDDDHGDVYFIAADGERHLIAESSRHTSPLDPETGYQDIRRTMRYLNAEVQVSPNKRWLLLRASCWEAVCPQVYDTETEEIYFVEPGYTNEVTWLADNRLRFEGWCDYPGTICHEDIYESASADRPWEMQRVQQEQSTSESINRDWLGKYEYTEFAEGIGSNMTWAYDLSIYEEEGQLMADFEVNGWQTHIEEKAIAEQEGDLLNIISKESLYDRYEGELLFSLRKISDDKLEIVWGRLQPNLLDPPDPYFTRAIEWQTYRNEEFGYEIKYPQDYLVTGPRFPETVGIGKGTEFEDGEELLEPNIFITVRKEPTAIGFHGTWSPILESDTTQEIVSSEEVSINGVLFTKKYWSEGNTHISAHTKHGDEVYTFSFALGAGGEEEIQIFDQILSTFRFVEEKAGIPSEDEALISSIRRNACYGHTGKCDDFVDRYIVDQQPLPSNVVEDDETLKNFLREGLNLLSAEELPLYRGIVGEEGEVGVLTYYNNIDNPVIIKITQESNLEGVLWLVPVNFFDSHGLRIFIGDMKELVANEPPFFRVSFTARVGTCVPVSGSFGLYQIRDEEALFNQLEEKVSIRTYIDNPQEGRVVESGISFEDTNGDGNMEIVQKGTEIICAEREDQIRYSCTSCATEELTNEIEKIFIWDSTQKRFVEKTLKE